VRPTGPREGGYNINVGNQQQNPADSFPGTPIRALGPGGAGVEAPAWLWIALAAGLFFLIRR